MSLKILALVISIIALSFLVGGVVSQTPSELQPRFNQAILSVQKAEAAGATPSELTGLVASLNRALELNEQALRSAGPNSADRRTQLLMQVDQILSSVEDNASKLQVVASQRTATNRIVVFVGGGVAAILVTLTYAICFSFWRRYRVKRTLQMKIVPK